VPGERLGVEPAAEPARRRRGVVQRVELVLEPVERLQRASPGPFAFRDRVRRATTARSRSSSRSAWHASLASVGACTCRVCSSIACRLFPTGADHCRLRRA
jgi:hypothetical protein